MAVQVFLALSRCNTGLVFWAGTDRHVEDVLERGHVLFLLHQLEARKDMVVASPTSPRRTVQEEWEEED